MSAVEPLLKSQPYQLLRVCSDEKANAFWFFMHSNEAKIMDSYRPCCSVHLLKEMNHYLRRCIDDIVLQHAENDSQQQISHLVLASDASVFNLGGDLDLFGKLMRQGDRDNLINYAHRCVQGAYDLYKVCLEQPVHTVALVQGDALGGGFEMALSCKTIVAERGVGMGFPEVLFGLFPGMGAYTFLKQRVSQKLAEDMMLNGTIYSSEDLYKMGVVDILVPKGEGIQATNDLIRKNQRIGPTRLAMHKVREAADPVRFEELLKISEIWVDTTLKLGEKSLKTMERLVRAQQRRSTDELVAFDAPNVHPLRASVAN